MVDTFRNPAEQAVASVVEAECRLCNVELRVHDGRACCQFRLQANLVVERKQDWRSDWQSAEAAIITSTASRRPDLYSILVGPVGIEPTTSRL